FFFSSRRRHTRFSRDWSSDVCSSDLILARRSNTEAVLHEPSAVLSRRLTTRHAYATTITPSTTYTTGSSHSDTCSKLLPSHQPRSEERRVGKESRSRGATYQYTTNAT